MSGVRFRDGRAQQHHGAPHAGAGQTVRDVSFHFGGRCRIVASRTATVTGRVEAGLLADCSP